MIRRILMTLLAVAALSIPTMVNADIFVTLGTQGGPLPTQNRPQPANAIIRDDGSIILVDAGDGAAEQLANAHLSLAKVTRSS